MSPWRAAYSALAWCALPLAIWRVRRRARGAKSPPPLREYFGKTAAHNSDANPNATVVWVHSVSVGEAMAAAELIRELRKRRPECEWILTHTTLAGRAKLESDFGDFARVAACPLDLPGATQTFIRRAKPALAVLMEAEYWPNLIAAASDSGAKLLLANARMGRKNARQYARVAPLTRETISRLDSIAAQTRADLRRLQFFGAKSGEVSGNLKFDREPEAALVARGKHRRAKLRERIGTRPIILFASVREGEGEMLIRAMDDSFLRNHFCVFAPRHPERCEGIAAELKTRAIPFSRASQGDEVGAEVSEGSKGVDGVEGVGGVEGGEGGKGVGGVEGEGGVGRVGWVGGVGGVGAHIADSLGEMAAHYAMCDAAFVGGGLAGGVGGQNPIEAMTQGVAAITGPDSANYAALTKSATQSGALLQAQDATDAVHLLRELCADDERRKAQGKLAQKFCESHRGALKITADLAEGLLP